MSTEVGKERKTEDKEDDLSIVRIFYIGKLQPFMYVNMCLRGTILTVCLSPIHDTIRPIIAIWMLVFLTPNCELYGSTGCMVLGMYLERHEAEYWPIMIFKRHVSQI